MNLTLLKCFEKNQTKKRNFLIEVNESMSRDVSKLLRKHFRDERNKLKRTLEFTKIQEFKFAGCFLKTKITFLLIDCSLLYKNQFRVLKKSLASAKSIKTLKLENLGRIHFDLPKLSEKRENEIKNQNNDENILSCAMNLKNSLKENYFNGLFEFPSKTIKCFKLNFKFLLENDEKIPFERMFYKEVFDADIKLKPLTPYVKKLTQNKKKKAVVN